MYGPERRGGGLIGKGWIAGGTGMEEVRQEGGSESGRTRKGRVGETVGPPNQAEV